jgi:hypothetical protein
MPIHDWSRVDAGLFHNFHQRWIAALCDALNTGGLPADYFALQEQVVSGPIPDVLTLRLSPSDELTGPSPGLAVAEAPPHTRHVQRTEVDIYARKADRVTVRHRHGQVIAVVEIVSPGNKASRSELHAFLQKTSDLIRVGIHLLVIDFFPPTGPCRPHAPREELCSLGPARIDSPSGELESPRSDRGTHLAERDAYTTGRDPQGIHKALWDEFEEQDFSLPPDKPLTLASYSAGPVKTAYVEPVAVGDSLPDMPLFLEPEFYVPAPLEATYQTAWSVFPAALKGLLESPPGST